MLARMRAVDEAALVCDFAETYHIYDYRKLDPAFAATLACGLRDDSRIMMRMSGTAISTDQMVQALSADALRFLAWAKTKDGQKNRRRPASIVEMLTNRQKQKEKDTVAFASGKAFDAAWKGLENGGRN